MHYYFFAPFPCALKINGKYCCKIENSVYHYQTEEVCLIEHFSLAGGGETRAFLLEEQFLLSPPDFLSVTDLAGGYFIQFLPQKKACGFNLIAQEKTEFFVATIFNENGTKLSIETPYSFYAEDLPCDIEGAEISYKLLNNELLIVIKAQSESGILLIYSCASDIVKVFSSTVNEFSFDNQLTTISRLNDFAKHTVERRWEYESRKFVMKSCKVNAPESFKKRRLTDNLKAYAFFEELLCGGDASEYLTESMAMKKDKLKGYLGEFCGVIPPPSFHRQYCVALIYKKSENFFATRYFSLTFINGKIDNLTEVK